MTSQTTAAMTVTGEEGKGILVLWLINFNSIVLLVTLRSMIPIPLMLSLKNGIIVIQALSRALYRALVRVL
jgi:uncharacterized membrane protein YgaE (UPF0421/DUF939 family)